MKTQRKTLRLLALSVCFGMSYQAHATAYTWTGADTPNPNDMTDAANWVPGLPVNGASAAGGTVMVFDNSALTTAPVYNGASPYNIDQILFGASAPAFIFSGTGELQPQFSGTDSITNNSAFTQTFNLDVSGYAGGGVNAAAADIVVNGTFHAGADTSTSSIHTAVLTGSHDIYLHQITGGNAMTYNGTGHLFLTSSSYTAGITVNSGVIVPADNNSFGTSAGSTTIGGGAAGSGSVALQGGLSLAESFVLVPRSAANPNANSPGLVSVSGNNTITGNFGNSTGTGSVTVESRGTTAGADSLVISGNINHNGSGTVTSLNLSGAGNGTWSGNITANQGNFDIVKNNGGTWTLSGTGNNVDGNYIVHGGTLVLAAGSTQHGVHYTVDPGAKLVVDTANMFEEQSYAISGTLGGIGTIHAPATITGGTLAPGDSPGTLTMANLTFGAGGGTLAYDLDATNHAVGGGINDLTVAAAVDLTGGAVLNVTPQNGSTLSLGVYELIDFTGLTGSAANITLGSVPVPQGDYAQIQIDSDSVNLAVLAPEPASIGLMGVGLLGFIRRRRR